jgi:hypothetical protein
MPRPLAAARLEGDTVNRKSIAIAAIAVAGVLAAAGAQARDRNDVQWSVTIGNPAPVWVQPAPVYGAPVVAYSYDSRYGRHDDRSYRGSRPTRWDRDGDGIPNRYDRVYNPRWDRDGDGVPNRYDRHDNRRDDHRGRGW